MNTLVAEKLGTLKKGRKREPERILVKKRSPESTTPTEGQYEYALALDERFKLNLTLSFLQDRACVERLIKCFGFHLDVNYMDQTGIDLINRLRVLYEISSDPEWISRKLNIDDLFALDVEFMIERLNASDRPLEREDINVDPEEVQYEREIDYIERAGLCC